MTYIAQYLKVYALRHRQTDYYSKGNNTDQTITFTSIAEPKSSSGSAPTGDVQHRPTVKKSLKTIPDLFVKFWAFEKS
jgi:hypothetical protein